MIPDAIFIDGKQIIMNLIEFKPVIYGDKLNPIKDEVKIQNMLDDNDLNSRKLEQLIKYNNWAIISEFLKLVCFDSELLINIQMAVYPRIS